MSTPQNPYNGNPYSPGTSQPQDPAQQEDALQNGNDMPATPSSSVSAGTGSTPQMSESPSYPVTSTYDDSQVQPAPTAPPYDGQTNMQNGAPSEVPTQVLNDHNQSAAPYMSNGQNTAQMPPQVPPQGSGDGSYPASYGAAEPKNADKWNGLVIAGFICSFFFGIVGLVLSVIGLIQVNKSGEKSKGMAIAGIAISVVNMLFSVIGAFVIINNAANETADNSLPTVSSSAPAPSTRATPDNKDDEDDEDDEDISGSDSSSSDSGAADARLGDDLLRKLRSGMTLEEAFKDPALKNALPGLEDEFTGQYSDMKVTAEGNTLIYTLRLDVEDRTDLGGLDLGTTLDSMVAENLRLAAKSLNLQTGRNDLKIRLIVIDSAGKTVLDRTYGA